MTSTLTSITQSYDSYSIKLKAPLLDSRFCSVRISGEILFGFFLVIRTAFDMPNRYCNLAVVMYNETVHLAHNLQPKLEYENGNI